MKNKNSFILWIIIIGLFAGFIAVVALSSNSEEEVADTNVKSQQTLYIQQAPDEKVVITEYSDFQCPACANMHQILQQAREEFGGEVSFAFRHFPLTSIHPNAMTAHRLAAAADQQGLFAEVHDTLFETQQLWASVVNPSDAITQLLTDAIPSLDGDLLQQTAASSDIMQAIQRDMTNGMNVGIIGTPTLFIGDMQLQIRSYADLQTILIEQLEQS